MSVALDVNTVTAALWPTATGKVTRSTGQILEVTLVDRGAARFTHIVFDPSDETKFYASTSEAVVYVFSIRKNDVKLFAVLEHPVASMACCGNGVNPLFVCATEDLTLIWLDCNTSRILRREKTPHRYAIHMMHAPVGFGTPWLATISRDALVLWDATQMVCRVNSHITVVQMVHDFLSVHAEMNFLVTVEYSGVVKKWDPVALVPIKAVTIAMRPRAATACQTYVAVGMSDAIVGFLNTSDLSSICCVQISTAPAAARSLSIINDDLLACELTDGTIVFLFVRNYSVSFAMTAPCVGAMRRSPSSFSVSGPSFGVFLRGDHLSLFHLPTARQYYLRRTKWNGVDPNPTLPRQVYPFLHRGEYTRALAPTEWEQTDIGDTTLPRPTIQLSNKQVSKWAKVDLLRSSADAADKAAGGHICEYSHSQFVESLKGRKKSEELEADVMNKEKELSQRPFLDRASRAANMQNLKRLLMRYGAFPDKYRSHIWRFLLELPERSFTAPQYTQLFSKGIHKCVSSLLKPFPLANKNMRAAMERVLSILAWHVPMFSVIHFLPMIVYPFLQLYGDDIQLTVEVVLVVLSNWGQEFFQYYPKHPVALTSLLNQLLRTEDLELHSYLEQCGVMVEEWAWEALKSLYTDILTSAAWLQVMDHAFFNRPLWFFLFYIRWLVNIREGLMKLHEHRELLAAFSEVHPIDVNKVIAETYQLHERCPKGDLSRPYSVLHAFVDYAYPVEWKCNEANIARKLEDLQLPLQQEGKEKEICQQIHGIREQMAEAEVQEDVFFEKKRAEIAAQLNTANDSLINEVAHEKKNQRAREMKNMARIQVVEKHLQQADRLEALREELVSARVQIADLAHIREREAQHWRRAESLTEHEVRRLEEAARERLAKAKQAIEEEEKKSSLQSREGGDFSGHATPPTTTTRTAATDVARNPLRTSLNALQTPVEPSVSVQAYRMLQSSVTPAVKETLRPQKPQGERSTGSSTDGQPPNLSYSPGVASCGPLYDNLLDGGVPKCHSEKKRTRSVDIQSQKLRPLSDRDERSSAGTVLLRSRDPMAYKIPRPLQEKLDKKPKRGG
ncbi:hypothetical protein C4B63_14g211 [Trypanosoma cruzi]|uniref:Rab-GAP TBC domain-containing protein n=1 Tax=Trypanosoma cruzi TaxID=5693 RepID=A0A2V2VNF2_TRYCR|nr:hypothetical protein C4B63_14g211 [Trypanosoma cruzi]